MPSSWHEEVYHAAHGGLAATLCLTASRLRGLFWACQIESQKNAGFLARVEQDQQPMRLPGRWASMVLLRTLKGGRFIGAVTNPDGKDDSDPHVGQRTYRNGVAFAFCSFALIIVSGLRFTLRGLPGELMQGIAQGFDTAQASMGFGVHPALIQHRRGSTQRLQTPGIEVSRAIIADFWKPPWGQAQTCTWQARKDLMVLMGQKKGVKLLVVLSNLLNKRQQLT